MELAALSQSPSVTDTKNVPPLKNPLFQRIQEAHLTLCEEPEMEQILLEIFKILVENEEKAGELAEKVILREQQIREKLTQVMQDESHVIHNSRKAQNFFQKLSDLVLPLALIGEGAVTMIAEGGPSPVSGAYVLLGGLAVLDVILDDAGKKFVAGHLSKLSGESKEQWLGRITMGLGLATFGLSMWANGSQAVQIVSTLSQLAFDCGETGAELYLKKHAASREEHLTEWDISGIRLQRWLGNLGRGQEAMGSLYDVMTRDMHSKGQTVSKIFAA